LDKNICKAHSVCTQARCEVLSVARWARMEGWKMEVMSDSYWTD